MVGFQEKKSSIIWRELEKLQLLKSIKRQEEEEESCIKDGKTILNTNLRVRTCKTIP
jgi:hypothetical protein